MAVTEVIEQLPGAMGGWSLQSGYALTVRLKVKADKSDGPMTIFAALPVNVGDAYQYPLTKTATETAAELFVQNVSLDGATPLADGTVMWTATVAYSRLDPSKDGGGPVGEDGKRDPFAAPPRLTWRSQVEEEAKILDRDGEWILNKAGDPFDPPIVVPRSVVVAVVRRVEREFSKDWIEVYEGHINSGTWLGFAAGEVLCQQITSDREWNEDVAGWVWNTEYQFAFKKSLTATNGKIIRAGWAASVINAGMRQLDPSSSKKVACLTDDKIPVSQPVLLKTTGAQADPDEKPNYLQFNVYPTANFAGLNMPSDLFTAGTPEV